MYDSGTVIGFETRSTWKFHEQFDTASRAPVSNLSPYNSLPANNDPSGMSLVPIGWLVHSFQDGLETTIFALCLGRFSVVGWDVN